MNVVFFVLFFLFFFEFSIGVLRPRGVDLLSQPRNRKYYRKHIIDALFSLFVNYCCQVVLAFPVCYFVLICGFVLLLLLFFFLSFFLHPYDFILTVKKTKKTIFLLFLLFLLIFLIFICFLEGSACDKLSSD